MSRVEPPVAPLKISPTLLLLDVIGSALLGLGLVELISPGAIVAQSLHVPYHAVMMIVAGILLTMPFLFNLFAQIKRRQQDGPRNVNPVQRQ